MRVGEFFFDPRPHRFRDFRGDGRGRLIVQIDHAALEDARSRMPRHVATKRSMSASLVCGPKLTRITVDAISAGMPMASSARLGFMLPDEQALPADIAMPARSNWTNWLALTTPGIA